MMYEELVKLLRENSHPNGLRSQAADAIEELSNAGSAYGRGWTLGYDAGREESKPRWIPVTERLPENDPVGTLVLCCLKKKDLTWVDVRFFMDGKFYHPKKQKGKVTHWMPLPEPPKEEPQIISAVDCKDCRYYPPSSLNGKPCTQCDMGNPLMNCFSPKEET